MSWAMQAKLILFLAGAFAAVTVAAEAPKTFKVSEFTFTRPAEWEWVETTSAMRQAQLAVPNPDGESAEVIFFYFGPDGAGGTRANVERWFGQFAEGRDQIKARTEAVTVGGHKITYVQAEGTYRSGIPGRPLTPKPNFALVGAIIEAGSGNVFVRLTGPEKLAKTAVPEFRKMIESGVNQN
jgi:hypothetical protein